MRTCPTEVPCSEPLAIDVVEVSVAGLRLRSAVAWPSGVWLFALGSALGFGDPRLELSA